MKTVKLHLSGKNYAGYSCLKIALGNCRLVESNC